MFSSHTHTQTHTPLLHHCLFSHCSSSHTHTSWNGVWMGLFALLGWFLVLPPYTPASVVERSAAVLLHVRVGLDRRCYILLQTFCHPTPRLLDVRSVGLCRQPWTQFALFGRSLPYLDGHGCSLAVVWVQNIRPQPLAALPLGPCSPAYLGFVVITPTYPLAFPHTPPRQQPSTQPWPSSYHTNCLPAQPSLCCLPSTLPFLKTCGWFRYVGWWCTHPLPSPHSTSLAPTSPTTHTAPAFPHPPTPSHPTFPPWFTLPPHCPDLAPAPSPSCFPSYIPSPSCTQPNIRAYAHTSHCPGWLPQDIAAPHTLPSQPWLVPAPSSSQHGLHFATPCL